MDCELAQQKIALFAYGELPDDQCHALEGHLTTCNRCQEEFAAVQALQQAMALAPAQEPSANLLAQARLRLEEALDSMPRTSWLMRIQQSMFRGVSMLGRAPVAASALLVLGLGSGGWAGYQYGARNHRPVAELAGAVEGAGKIASVSSIAREPNTENVEVHFNRLVPETTQGSLDDARIRELLVLGAQSQLNPGVAQKSVNLLAQECQEEHQCGDGPIRKALLVALRNDKDDKVRLNALNGLKPYVAEDMSVRDGVLEALLDDSDATIRSRAIELLHPVEADSSVREVLHTVASEDDNPHIRTVSQEVLDQSPHIQ
jgi:HEAT repeats/Putative zinc-finger